MRHGIPWIITAAVITAAPMALAQPLDRANLHEVDDDDAMIYEGRSIEELDDMDVVRDGERIGEIEDVLANADNQIVAVVLEYDEGFLGLNDSEVILPIDQIQFDQNAASVTLSDAELRALPVWDD
jgi:sporulation protein YlmC with PRC-barrel domain